MMKVNLVKRQYALSASSFLLSVGVITWIYCYLPFEIEWLTFTLLMVVMQGILILWDRYKKMPLLYGGGVAILISIYWLLRHNEWSVIGVLERTYYWLQSYDGTKEAYEVVYARICMAGMILGVSVLSYIGSKVQWIKSGFLMGVLVALVFMAFQEIQIPKVGLICLLTYSWMQIVEMAHRKYYVSGKAESWKITWTLCPVFIGAMLLIAILPYKETALSWNWVSEAIQKAEESFQDLGAEISFRILGSSDEFGLNFLGAQEEQKLGGNIGNSDAQMLEVLPLKKVHDSIYLAGNYKDTYTGSSWSSKVAGAVSDVADYRLDTYELIYGLAKRETKQDIEQLIQESEARITYDCIRTKTLFMPGKTEEVSNFTTKNDLSYEGSGAFFSKRQKRGSYYVVSFVELNTESNCFREYAQDMAGFSYEEMKPLEEDFLEQFHGVINGSTLNEMLHNDTLQEQLLTRSQQIEADYLNLPEQLPDRVKVLTIDLTKNYENTYAQLKAIETYLRTYKYTQTPGEIPKGQDFVDYFLFESKEGYCTYFASAMAVMARTIGIPTRYVEGFIADYSNSQKGSKSLSVTGQKAHAWVEAYIKGIGWVRFEPSAGYEVQNYTPWEVEQGDKIIKAQELPIMEQEIEQLSEKVMDAPQLEESESISQMLVVRVKKGLKGLGILGVIAIILGKLKIENYNRRLKKAAIDKKVRLRFEEVIYILGKMGYKLRGNETLLQFQTRVSMDLGVEGDELKRIISTYSKVRYGKLGCEKGQTSAVSEVQLKEQAKMLEDLNYLCQMFLTKQLEKYGKIKRLWWHLAYKLYGYKNVK